MLFLIGTVMIIIAGVLGLVLSVKKSKRRKKTMNDEEVSRKPKFGSNYKPKMYKPKMYGQGDLQKGFDFKQRQQEPQRQPEQYPNIRRTPQKPLFQTRLPESEPEPEPESEDEPYWQSEDWEDWAYQIYLNYPEVRQFLPDWFIKALEEELSKQ